MASTVVELSGDEAALLRSLQNVIAKEVDHEKQLGRMADAGNAAGQDLEKAMGRVEKANNDALKGLLSDLAKVGPNGRTAADALRTSFTNSGKPGYESIDSILKKIVALDPAAVDAANAIRTQLAAADKQSQFDATLTAMRGLGGAAATVADRVKSELKTAGNTPEAFDKYLAELKTLDPAAHAVAERIRTELAAADKQSQFDATLTAMRSLGPQAAAVAEGIKSELKEAGNTPVAFDKYLAELTALDPAAAKVAATVQAKLAAADKKSQFDATLKSLRALGGQSAKVADKLESELKTAAAAAAGSMDQIVAKLAQLDPTVSAMAEKIQTELAMADSQTKFDDSLAELRKLSPEAAKAAEKVRTELSRADAEVKFDNIIAELKKIDPVAAQEAEKLKRTIKTSADDGALSWDNFAKKSITQIGAVAGAYLGVQESIAAVNTFIAAQEKLLDNALQKQLELAKAQEESAKNLLGYNEVQRNELLQKAVPEIARETGFADIAKITLAIGNAASAGATPEQARQAAATSARLNRLNPDNVADNAGGIASVMQQTALQDPRQAASLLATAGPISKVDDAAKLALSLPRAVGSIATVPNQDPEEAARQVASMFGVVTNRAVDDKGESTATFLGKFINRMDNLFTNLEDKQVDARSKVELIDRKIHKGKDTEGDRRDRENLLSFLGEAKDLKDPGTIFGRLGALQANPATQKQFLGETGQFGEEQFQVALKELLNSESVSSKNLAKGFESIRADAAFFEDKVASQSNATPQLSIANAIASAQAGVSTQEGFDTVASSLKAVREITSKASTTTNPGGVQGFLESFYEEGSWVNRGINDGILPGEDAVSEGISGIEDLSIRRNRLTADGVTSSEEKKIANIDTAIKALVGLLEREVTRGTFDAKDVREEIGNTKSRSQLIRQMAQGDSDIVRADALQMIADKLDAALALQTAAIERQNTLVETQNGLLAETADNTRPGEGSPPDYDSVNRASLAEADAR